MANIAPITYRVPVRVERDELVDTVDGLADRLVAGLPETMPAVLMLVDELDRSLVELADIRARFVHSLGLDRLDEAVELEVALAADPPNVEAHFFHVLDVFQSRP